MKRVSLHGGGGAAAAYALIDDDDLDLVKPYRWRLHPRGYAVASAQTLMHRLLLGLHPGDGLEGDHINHNKLDNRRANIRVVTRAQNAQNHPGFGGSSPYRGVFRCGNCWEVRVRANGYLHYIGRYVDELHAARAAEAFRREHLPFAGPDPLLAEAEAAA